MIPVGKRILLTEIVMEEIQRVEMFYEEEFSNKDLKDLSKAIIDTIETKKATSTDNPELQKYLKLLVPICRSRGSKRYDLKPFNVSVSELRRYSYFLNTNITSKDISYVSTRRAVRDCLCRIHFGYPLQSTIEMCVKSNRKYFRTIDETELERLVLHYKEKLESKNKRKKVV